MGIEIHRCSLKCQLLECMNGCTVEIVTNCNTTTASCHIVMEETKEVLLWIVFPEAKNLSKA